MRRRPKYISFALLATALLVTSCGANSDGGEDGDAEVITLKAGYENHPGEPLDQGMQKWAELLEERSDGALKMELYPSSQLGSKTELIDQMHSGAPVITLGDGAFFADQGVPDFGIMFAPYLFETWDNTWKLVESEWFAEKESELAEKGLQILTSNWIYGDRDTLVKGNAETVDDLRGMKIRVPDNVIQVAGFKALGATPTPMALGDVYTSLQQGTIDGFEQPVPVIAAGQFAEVADTLLLTNHVRNSTVWFTGTGTFEALTPEQQQILRETGNEAGLVNNDAYFDSYEESLKEIEEAGVKVVEIDHEQFAERAAEFYDLPEIKSLFSDGLYETVKEQMS